MSRVRFPQNVIPYNTFERLGKNKYFNEPLESLRAEG